MLMLLRFDLFFILVDECNKVTDYAIARKIVDLHTKVTVLTQPLQIFSFATGTISLQIYYISDIFILVIRYGIILLFSSSGLQVCLNLNLSTNEDLPSHNIFGTLPYVLATSDHKTFFYTGILCCHCCGPGLDPVQDGIK